MEEAGPHGGEEGSWEQRLTPELQQGLRILQELLQERHRGLAPALLRGEPPLEEEGDFGEGQEPPGEGVPDGAPAGLLGMQERFRGGHYRQLAEFVSDLRGMLERVYRQRGVEHWLSRQGQRLERLLEQKLALLSWPLREKTAIVVTSKGRYGLEDEKATCTSTRRRSTTRSSAGQTTGVFESVMVQALRQEEQLRAKQEKRLREQGKKEAEEASQKELEEWEKNLFAQAAPNCMENMWEIPAIGHFLCLAQQILNLPEIVFYELERCLLMPQTNVFLSKIMTSLLSPPHRRPSLHRRPPLPYRTWEAALRQKVHQWYSVVGQAENPDSCAEKLGLGSQFFRALGEVSPLEEKPFHELSFYQKVWLLKGLCDFVYETQHEVQDAVLGQPIHECREVILGYDSQENAYIHFPQFCGADVRIYKQIPFYPPEFPIAPIKIRKLPRIKLEKVKCEPMGNDSGDDQCVSHEMLLSHPKTEPETLPNDCPAKFHVDCCSACTEQETQPICEIKMYRSCDLKKAGCCKENLKKLVSPGKLLGCGDSLSPGEIRIVENGDKYVERPLGKTEASPLNENALKTCQVHVNGSHSDSPDMNCHRVAKDVILEHSLLNRKKLKLTKLRGKKKKKKKKKPKSILNENLHGKHAGPPSHSFKSYKSEIQSKMFLIKKKTKHKKHKSGKKSISKRAITKKRKTVSWSPTIPEFQLVCTNLDELRELITKIDVELKEFGNDRKKSVKSHVRKQTVRELHSTLKRLLKELLPWEPKLMKAFQRNRARLKKEYDDFKRQPDHDKFTREVWTNEETDVDFGKESPGTETKTSLDSSENEESLKKNEFSDIKVTEMDLLSGKSKLPIKELFPTETQQTLPKLCKRQCKQNCCPDNSTDDSLPSKKFKLGICENSRHCMEGEMQTNCSFNELKETEPSDHDPLTLMDSEASFASFLKVSTPIQTLEAKNIGDKLTLTNQLLSNASRSINVSERSAVSTAESSQTKSTFLCQTSIKNPLQVVYKMPGGQCVPVDLQNSSVKIQMQPVIDPKTGEKLMQQVLVLPKNFFIQHKEGPSTAKESLPLQIKSAEKQFAHFPQAININSSFTAPVLGPAHSQLTSSVLSKSVVHLAKLTHPIRSPPLPTTILASTTKVNRNEAYKVASTTSTTTFPITTASPAVSTVIQPSMSLATLSGDTSKIFAPHETLQKTSDSSEIKQELKTVCIRDSQSILVRTRGGNTGVVKVQTNHEKCSTNSLATSSAFTYTPQLQAFLIPRATTLPSSSLSSVTAATTVSTVLPFAQSTMSRFAPPPPVSIPACLNQLIGKHMTLTTGQSPSIGSLGPLVDKTIQSSTFGSTSSLANCWLPSSSGSSIGAINIALASSDTMDSGNVVQNNNAVSTQITSQPDMEHMRNLPTVQPDSTSPTNGDAISGAPVQKLLLVTSPVIPSGDASTFGTVSTPTSAAPPQKFIFINTDISSGSSASSLTAESTKQGLPTTIGKTLLNTSEQPHVLLPSTVGGSIKLSPSPTVSQVKEVKIGLNIGQTFINTAGTAHNVTPVNLLQNACDKGIDDKNRKGFVLPVTTSNLVPLCPINQNTVAGNGSVSVGARGASIFTGTTVNACLGSFSATESSTSGATSAALVNHGNDNPSRIIPFVGNRLSTSNVGNTVAISTVKTGHLASSVLISSTQSTVAPQNIPTTLFPGLVSFPAPVTTTQKGNNFVPATVPCLPIPKGQPQTLLHFQSPGNAGSLITNIQKPQIAFPSALSKASKIIGLSNFASLPPSTPKTLPCSSVPSVSSAMQTAIASPLTSQVGQFGETCIQQKIVLNTSTPLAPGTQIMINGTRFIVPSNGLGAGSHVLIISTNAKQGPPLVVNSAQGVQKPISQSFIPKNPPSNFLTWQPSRHPLKSSTNIVNSLGSANAPPIVHSTPQVADTTAKISAVSPATTMTMASIPRPQSAFVTKTSLVSAMRACNPQFPNNTPVLHFDTSVKKLLVSPEGAILNSINTSVSKLTSLSPASSHIVESPSKILPAVFPRSQSTGLNNQNTDI